MRLRGLSKLPDGRDWWREKLVLLLVGRAMLSKTLIHIFVDGWGSAPPVSCLVWGNPALGSVSSMVGLMVTSKRAYAKGSLKDSCSHAPVPMASHCQTTLHGRPSNTKRRSGSVSCGVIAPFAWVMVHARFCLWPPKPPLFPLVLGSPIIKSCWPSKSNSLGIHSPFFRSPAWEPWHGTQNLHNSGRTSLVLLFSSLWVTHPAGMGCDFITIVPLLPYHCSFFLVFGFGISFFGGF